MKKILSALFFSLAIVAIALGNGIDVPTRVNDAFKAKYPLIKTVNWNLENGIYTAEFEENDFSIACSFDEDGNWTKTVSEISEDDLSENILAYLEDNYDSPSIVLAAKIETEESITFSVSIEVEEESEDEDEDAETKEYTLIFDEDGKKID